MYKYLVIHIKNLHLKVKAIRVAQTRTYFRNFLIRRQKNSFSQGPKHKNMYLFYVSSFGINLFALKCKFERKEPTQMSFSEKESAQQNKVHRK